MGSYIIIVNIIGIFIFLFIFWQKLREDYIQNQIFSTAFSIIFGIFLANIIAKALFPGWWFWASFVGTLAGFVVGILRFKLRVLESLQALVAAVLPWLGLIFLGHAIQSSSLVSFLASGVSFLLVGLYFLLEKHYKKFTWYKSGRVGFSGLATAGVFFLLRGAVASAFPDVLSFSGKSEPYLSGVLAFIIFMTLFNLARKGQ